jgi:hypothetical protein
VPAQISYQGVLLDTLGEPRTGNVDLTLRIWDAPTGGTLIYKQVFPSVALAAGVFTVRLGPTGAASDTPDDPLTTSLADALGGDAGPTAPTRFLEVTVGIEGALARTQILTAPYALRAASADSAATAAMADDVMSVGGVDAGVIQQIFEYGNTDGQGPPNTDPSEGTADVDGDGAMNFVDGDNDDDGIPDGTELTQGSDINLVTPSLSALQFSPVLAVAPAAVGLLGNRYEPGMSVLLDGNPLAPFDVTPTSARFQPPAPHPVGSFPVRVQLANGQLSTSRTLSFLAQPAAGVSVPVANHSTVSISVRGVAKVAVATDEGYGVDSYEDGTTNVLNPSFDQMGNPSLHPTPPQIAVAWGADGRLVGLRCHPTGGGTGCQVQVIRDADGDYLLDPGTDEVLLGPSYSGTDLNFWGPSLANDASGNIVAGYVLIEDAGTARPTVLHDVDGNGAFAASAPETIEIETLPSSPGNLGKLAVDPAGRLVFAYATRPAGQGPTLRVAYDRNGDGDFADASERYNAFVTFDGSSQGRPCGGVAFDGAGHLAAVFSDVSAISIRVARDLTGDGDFADAGDSVSFPGSATSGCDIAGHPSGGLAIVYVELSGQPLLLIDRNSDGDFADTNESQNYGSSISREQSRLGVTFSPSGRAFAAGHSPTTVFVDPF